MNLGLYLHVPFCRSKCSWCAFASEAGSSRSELWLERVVEQLANPAVTDASWSTVYLGGGTPTLLTPVQLERLLKAVARRLETGAEMTLEANPESLTQEHLKVFSNWGGTRLSVGIQTFDEDILVRHGRPTRKADLDRTFTLTRAWPGELSLDLICALAGQTEAGQQEDLEEALTWNPDHLSFYSLTLEPGTPLAAKVAEKAEVLPAEDQASLWWLQGRDRLEAAGLNQYEVSNFARPGAQSRHNGRYWALEPWLGLGPSATSFLPAGPKGLEYRTEPELLEDWLAGREGLVEVVSGLELAKDKLLAGLRRTAGVESTEWTKIIPETIDAWTGRLINADGHLFLSREAFPFLDTFLREAFAELDSRPEFR